MNPYQTSIKSPQLQSQESKNKAFEFFVAVFFVIYPLLIIVTWCFDLMGEGYPIVAANGIHAVLYIWYYRRSKHKTQL